MTFSESCRDVFEGAPPTAGVDRNVQYVPSMLVDHFGNQPSEESAESLRRRPSGGARKDFWMPSGPIPLAGVRFAPPSALGDRRWLHDARRCLVRRRTRVRSLSCQSGCLPSLVASPSEAPASSSTTRGTRTQQGCK